DEKQKGEVFAALKEDLEVQIQTRPYLKSPPKILLSVWSSALDTNTTSNSPQTTAAPKDGYFTPSAKQFKLVTALSKRFVTLGMASEARRAKALMKALKPADFQDDPKVKKLWANELVALAEEYRKSNENLEAGRAYALAGRESED